MARIIYSSQVDEIKGSIGGLVFNANTAGKGVRLKPRNKYTGSIVQNEYKSMYIYLCNIWNSLDTNIKEEWASEAVLIDTYNAWGEKKVWSGMNFFISAQIGRLLIGEDVMSYVGALESISAPVISVYNVNSSELSVTLASSITDTDYYYMFYLSPPNTLGYKKQRTQLRLVYSQALNGDVDVDLTSAFEAAYGLSWPIADASNVFSIGIGIRIYNMNNGSWSQYVLNYKSYEQL
jgi:hypothetical protein